MHYASIRGPHIPESMYTYAVAMIGKLLKNIGLFADYSLILCGSFAKETYVSREPTNRSHLISEKVYIYTHKHTRCLSLSLTQVNSRVQYFKKVQNKLTFEQD